jgi:hypothetical protein
MIHTQDMKTGLVEIVVTNTTFNGDAFAAMDDGTNVYISPTLVSRFDVEVGQYRQAKLAANSPMHVERGVPWRAFYIEPLGTQLSLPGFEPEPEPEEQDDEGIILDHIDEHGFISTGGVCEKLGVSANKARQMMEKLHRHGEVMRADVYTKWGHQKASKSVWIGDHDFFHGA